MVSRKTLLVKIGKCSLPDNTTKTMPFIEHTLGTPIKFPKNVDEILVELEKSYDQLIHECRSALLSRENNKVPKLILNFLEVVNKLNVEIQGLEASLSADLNLPISEIKKYLQYENIQDKIVYIKEEYRSRNKKDPIKYAETVEELVNIMGKEAVKEETGMKESTIDALLKVAKMPKEIKDLISTGKLKLTTAFEIPAVSSREQIKIARELAGLSYTKAKERLRKLKEKYKKTKRLKKTEK